MKTKLFELGYTPSDVASLNPERAAAIIDNAIRRPSQGVPETWKRRGGSSRGSSSLMSKAFAGATKIAGAGLVTALALHFGGQDLGEFSLIVDALIDVVTQSTKTHR